MNEEALRHLRRDRNFAALIRRIGPPRLGVQRRRSPYEALMRAIAHQQLHGRAALAIMARFEALYPADGFPPPELVLASSELELRACGFSGSKIAAMRAICTATLDGTVPTRRGSARLSDEDLIERLTSIRGVGRWTVEMLLIFRLGRMDVLPVDDYGVRKGAQVTYRMRKLPTKARLTKVAEKWRPWRSVGSWYMWRAADIKTVGEK
jgi:DNA-3-methyladenine glycosylase II